MKRGDCLALTILDEQLKIGQVKFITSDFGKAMDYAELLFSPTTKAQFKPNSDKTGLIFSVSDNNFDLPEMICELDRDTLRNLIVALKNMYNELQEPAALADSEDNAESKADSNVGFCCNKNVL